jgi:hypothetical protein
MVLVPKIREHTVDYMASILSRGGGGGVGGSKVFRSKEFCSESGTVMIIS